MVSHILISLHSDLVSILYPLSSILYPLRLRIYVIFVHKFFPGTPYGRRRHVLENYLSLDKFAGYLYQDQFKTLEKFYWTTNLHSFEPVYKIYDKFMIFTNLPQS